MKHLIYRLGLSHHWAVIVVNENYEVVYQDSASSRTEAESLLRRFSLNNMIRASEEAGMYDLDEFPLENTRSQVRAGTTESNGE